MFVFLFIRLAVEMGKGKKKVLKDAKLKRGKETDKQMISLKNELKSLEFQSPGPHFQAFYQTIPPRSRAPPQPPHQSEQFLGMYVSARV